MVTVSLLLLICLSADEPMGTLDSVRQTIRTGSPSDKSSSNTESSTSQPSESSAENQSASNDKCNQSNGYDDGLSLSDAGHLCALAGIVALSPFWGPPCVLEDDGGQYFAFSKFPYATLDHETYLPSMILPETDGARTWRSSFLAEAGTDFNHVDRYALRGSIDTVSRWGALGSWTHYEERQSNGKRDQLDFGNLLLTYRFAQSATAQFHVGAGTRIMSDKLETNVGFDSVYAFSWYPRRPFVLQSELHLGFVDRAFVGQWRVTAGITYDRFELFTGYDGLLANHDSLPSYIVGVALRY